MYIIYGIVFELCTFLKQNDQYVFIILTEDLITLIGGSTVIVHCYVIYTVITSVDVFDDVTIITMETIDVNLMMSHNSN